MARHSKQTGLTYPLDVGQTLLEQRGLDERGEPLLLVPVPDLVAGDLAEAHDDRVHSPLLRGVLQDVLSDPLSFAVAGAEGRRGIVKRHFGCGCGTCIVYKRNVSSEEAHEGRNATHS